MKKSIYALAASAAFTSAALAQTSSVTIYGLADLGVDLQRGGVAGTVYKLSSGIQNGSRLGFKGTEDLGDGLAAIFVLEMGIAMDTGALNQGGLAFGRQSYAGLTSRLGSLTLGRQYTAVNNALCGEIDPFGCGLAGHAGNLMSVGGTPTNGGNGSRTNNAVRIATTSFEGFKAEATFGFGEVGNSNHSGRTIGGSVGYGGGPLTLRVAYNSVIDPSGVNNAQVTFIGGKYDAKFATFSLGYAINKNAFSANSNIANPDSRDHLIGVAVPVGVGTILASYVKKVDHAGSNDASQAAIGYTYALSKRTNLYTSYGHIHNNAPNTDKAHFYTVGNAIDAGTGNSSLNLGIRHVF